MHLKGNVVEQRTQIGTARLRAAFSLVELSIVIVVIGLLVGGILVGQGMIHSAKLRTVTTDASMYRTALDAFRDKYYALPGDMANATQFWGPADGVIMDVGVVDDCANLTTAAVGFETCNGNGNGYIAEQAGQYYESYRGWQQLATAGMVKGKFSGVSNTIRTEWGNTPNVNAPGSKLDKRASWTLRSFADDYAGDAEWFPTKAGNFLMIGASRTNSVVNMNSADAVFTPGEALLIDRKQDDGIPGTGTVTSFRGDGTLNDNCTSGGAATDPYRADDPQVLCSLIFRILPKQ